MSFSGGLKKMLYMAWLLLLVVIAVVIAAPAHIPLGDFQDESSAWREQRSVTALAPPETPQSTKKPAYFYRCSGPLSKYDDAACQKERNPSVCYYVDTVYVYRSCAADCNDIRMGSTDEERCRGNAECRGYLKKNCDLELDMPPTTPPTMTTTVKTSPRRRTTEQYLANSTQAAANNPLKNEGQKQPDAVEGYDKKVLKLKEELLIQESGLSTGDTILIVVVLIVAAGVAIGLAIGIQKYRQHQGERTTNETPSSTNRDNSRNDQQRNVGRVETAGLRPTDCTLVTFDAAQVSTSTDEMQNGNEDIVLLPGQQPNAFPEPDERRLETEVTTQSTQPLLDPNNMEIVH